MHVRVTSLRACLFVHVRVCLCVCLSSESPTPPDFSPAHHILCPFECDVLKVERNDASCEQFELLHVRTGITDSQYTSITPASSQQPPAAPLPPPPPPTPHRRCPCHRHNTTTTNDATAHATRASHTVHLSPHVA